MLISLIVAVDQAGGIGFQGFIPWRLPDDLKRFKELTLGHHLVMGRKTYESIGKPLPGRTTIVVTHNIVYRPLNCLVAYNLAEALELARTRGEENVFVCGGGELYALALPFADRIHLTRVEARFPADVFFPAFTSSDWDETIVGSHSPDEKHAYGFTFYEYIRRQVPQPAK